MEKLNIETKSGLLTNNDFKKLGKFINGNEVIKSKVSWVNNGEVLSSFNSQISKLKEDPNELVADKKLNFLFYVLKNSIVLNLSEEEKTDLQPLSNLALSVEMMDGLKRMVKRYKLSQFLLTDIVEQSFTVYCQTVDNCNKTGEFFLLDTFKAEKMVVLYHTFRNKVLKFFIEQLQNFVEPGGQSLNAGDLQNNRHNFLRQSILGLDWDQQVIAFESMYFEFPLSEAFQEHMSVTLLTVMGIDVDVKAIPQPSYYKSTKIHCCKLCDYGTKKLSNIKNHLKGKHRLIIFPPGEPGFTTKNEHGEILNYVPRKRKKNKSATDTGDVAEELDDTVRIHQCNFCQYESEKMSNIKSHIRGVHRDISLTRLDTGFTTLFKPVSESGMGLVIDQDSVMGNVSFEEAEFIKKETDCMDTETDGEPEEEEEDCPPPVGDFLECMMELNEDQDVQEGQEEGFYPDMGSNEDADASIDPLQLEPTTSVRKVKIRRRWGKKRLQQCNFCEYTSNKMSNIKMHVKNVHKSIPRLPGEQGFTTHFV